jgi:nitrite reductase/ring-hydroxylating ferredoxin subunit
MNLNDPQFINLNVLGGAVLVDRNTNNWGHYAAGYAGSGIIVARGLRDGEFFAYDRTCPHDFALNGSVIKINLDPTGISIAKCPQCGTTYLLTSFGTPYSGVGKYPLKNYMADADGYYVRVWNSY